MSLQFSPIAIAEKAVHGAQFSAHRLDLIALSGFIAPIMGFDHFRMSGPTFAPHPHAGFSAVSYVFEDSAGGLRNRDSLGHDLVIEPGAMVWTQAASGVVHDELPASRGSEVHGLQLFVNLSRDHKNLAPKMLYAAAEDVPVVNGAGGTKIRVLSGRYQDVVGPINPAEPFEFLDVKLTHEGNFEIPRGRNVLFYILSGQVTIGSDDAEHSLGTHQAIAVRSSSEGAELRISTKEDAHLLVLCGVDPMEPVAVYGPFIMNDQSGLQAAYSRYVAGEMGRLSQLASS
ncbi:MULTISPECIES: pirin family protein [unclassified Pseudomonas]|uniref:pirin family protein n=1 Tax=unclassified Pseudomonas TaxID=196821 RepID=UPI00068BD798|nr:MULTISPECIES: pirin family protein [unclassified Pseudomonas]AMK37613.1 pirin and cupin2 superfamily-related protein [Pseudomonas sp. C5pp]